MLGKCAAKRRQKFFCGRQLWAVGFGVYVKKNETKTYLAAFATHGDAHGGNPVSTAPEMSSGGLLTSM